MGKCCTHTMIMLIVLLVSFIMTIIATTLLSGCGYYTLVINL